MLKVGGKSDVDCSDEDLPVDSTKRLVAELSRVTAALLNAGSPVGLAVSGGSDSVALAGLACRVGLGPRLRLLHVDHRVGAHAAPAARACAELAERLELPLLSGATEAQGARSETRLREQRWAQLETLAARAGVAQLLLAHHADDRRETVGLALLRGHRGARALAGPPWLRLQGPRLLVLRPLLACAAPPGRHELRAWRLAAGLDAAEDPGNADLDVPRNRLRAELARDPALRARLDRLAAHSRLHLRTQMARAVQLLERELRPCGQGSVLRRAALEELSSAADPGWLAEVLALLAASLARPRRVAPGLGRLRRLGAQLAQLRGECVLDASSELAGPLRRDGLHLPGEPLADPSVAVSLALGLTRRPWPG